MFEIVLICGIAAAIVIATFAYVAISTRRPEHVDKQALYRGRTVLFVVSMPLLIVILGFTLPKAPYVTELSMPDDVVYVAAKQYGYAVARQPLADDAAWGAHAGDPPVSVKAGALVEFKVTALDVNHSFAIYNARHQLIAQTQAMPHYVNRLRVRLPEPGTYDVFCLEYCGMGHHTMHTTILAHS